MSHWPWKNSDRILNKSFVDKNRPIEKPIDWNRVKNGNEMLFAALPLIVSISSPLLLGLNPVKRWVVWPCHGYAAFPHLTNYFSYHNQTETQIWKLSLNKHSSSSGSWGLFYIKNPHIPMQRLMVFWWYQLHFKIGLPFALPSASAQQKSGQKGIRPYVHLQKAAPSAGSPATQQ